MKKVALGLFLVTVLFSCDTRMTWRTYNRRCVKIVSDYNSNSIARDMCRCEVEKLKEAGYSPQGALELSTENIKRVESIIKDC